MPFIRPTIIFCVLLLTALTAHAEHRLLDTDTLNLGQADAAIDYTFLHSSYDIHGAYALSAKQDIHETELELRAGLWDGLHISFVLPYEPSNETTYNYNSNPSFTPAVIGGPTTVRRDGLADVLFGIKYRLIDQNVYPFALSVGFEIKPYTASATDAGSGTTEFRPALLFSSTVPDRQLAWFASYRAIISDHLNGDTHHLGGGFQYHVDQFTELVPSVNIDLHGPSGREQAYQEYALDLQDRMEVVRNFYLIPHIGFGVLTGHALKNIPVSFGDLNFFEAGLTLYYFYQ